MKYIKIIFLKVNIKLLINKKKNEIQLTVSGVKKKFERTSVIVLLGAILARWRPDVFHMFGVDSRTSCPLI